jgi:AbiTii
MTMSHRAQVQSLLLDQATPLVKALNATIVLADEYGDAATAAWARQEIDGYPVGGPLPDYRKVVAPIVGAGMPHGREARCRLSLADLPASRRAEIARLDTELGLPHGVSFLEGGRNRTLLPATPHPLLRPELPGAAELIRLLPERADGITFATLYWDIGSRSAADVLARIRATAEERVRALEAPYPWHDDNDHREGTLAKVTINKREIARMARDMQKEFNKHPIRVPIEADPQLPPMAGTTITNNFGVIFHNTADGAQVALNTGGDVQQQQNQGDQVAPGYELIAQAVAHVMEGLARVELADDDRQDAEEAAAEIVTEVTTAQPNTGKVRRAVKVLKGALAPVAAGLTAATTTEVQEWARTAIDQLGAAL